MKNQSFLRRLAFALAGLRTAFQSEASFRSQLLIAALAVAALSWLRPPLVWAALCLISGGAVLAAEMMNTALERLADRLHPEQHASIRAAKDCAAAAVLLASMTALLIGCLTVAVALHLLG